MKSLRLPLESARAYACLLAAVLFLGACGVRYQLSGDIAEYSLMTVALANHGTPDIRAADIAEAIRVAPELDYAFVDLQKGIARGDKVPRAGFHLDNGGNVQAIHFFAYSALAVIPYKLLDAVGAPPMKCYQFVNAALLLVLGLALRRFFGNGLHALGGLALYLLCGGLAYANWSSPESVTASALLAGLLLCGSSAPLAGGVLVGLAATQNPSVVLALGLIPVIVLCNHWRPGMRTAEGWERVWHAPVVGGLAAGALLFAANPLFNLHAFGVPSIIAVGYTVPELGTWERLHSVFLDLNQGMFLAIPAVAVLMLWLAFERGAARSRILLACVVLVILGMTLPALVVTNWNSGAAGVMRYAFWAAMPLLFVLLWQLRERGGIGAGPTVAVLLVQALAMGHMLSYPYTAFSPLALWAMRHAPAWYNPDPEIFYERALRGEVAVGTDDILRHSEGNLPLKTMYHLSNQHVDERLCGKGHLLALDNSFTETTQHWRYINGDVRCVAAPGYFPVRFDAEQFGPGGVLGDGWSPPQFGDQQWTGTWSSAPVSYMRLPIPARMQPRRIFITGFYHEPAGHTTRVSVNGHDYGWVKLDGKALPFDVPPAPGPIVVELEHKPITPPPGAPDQRRIALFLQNVVVQ